MNNMELVECMRKSNLSIIEASKLFGVSAQAVRYWRTGSRKVPSYVEKHFGQQNLYKVEENDIKANLEDLLIDKLLDQLWPRIEKTIHEGIKDVKSKDVEELGNLVHELLLKVTDLQKDIEIEKKRRLSNK